MEFSQLHNPDHILLVGAGSMASSYVHALRKLNVDLSVICRSKESAKSFSAINNVICEYGGIDKYLLDNDLPSSAIVCVGVDDLFSVTKILLKCGVKHILVEKPGVLFEEQLKELIYLEKLHNAHIFIGYNRRFLNSVSSLKRLAKEDGGIRSLTFDFTEWSDKIEPLKKGKNVKERWFLSNSSHVVDLAFNLMGLPETLTSMSAGGLPWHPTASRFIGVGLSKNGVHFSYRSDWNSAGRWQLCAFTENFKLELCPLEKLYVTRRNEVLATEHLFEDTDDEVYKPGLIKQLKAFLGLSEFNELCSLKELGLQYGFFTKIAGYEK